MLNNNAAFKYETPYKGLFEITLCWNNGTFILNYSTIQLGLIYVAFSNIHLMLTWEIL